MQTLVRPQRRPRPRTHVLILGPSFSTFARTISLPTIASTARTGLISLLNPTADMQLFIAGALMQWRESSMQISLTLGATGSASFTLFSRTTYRPAPFDEVVFFRKGTRRFGGLVQSVTDVLVPSTDTHELFVVCTDYMGYLDRVIIAKLYTVPIGFLAWIILFDIIQVYLKQFGITFAGFATSGGALGEVLFHYVTGSQAVAQLVAASPGCYVWIDAFKALHFAQAGSATPGGFGVAPYSLSDTSLNFFDFSVSVDDKLYRNKQWVLPSANVLALKIESFTGDGVTTGFFTLYVLTNTPLVTVNGARQTVATLGGPYPAGWTWYYIPGGQGVFQRLGSTPLSALDTLNVAYPNPFALAVSAQNDAEIALHGLVEAISKPQNVNDVATANAMAATELAAYCPDPPESIVFTTNEERDARWLTPGMTLNVTKTIPAASGSYTVESVVSQEHDATLFKHTITVRKNTGALNYQRGLQLLAGGALSESNNNSTETAGFELGVTVVGLTNPGLAIGQVFSRYTFLYNGVLSFWSILFATDPPTGADIVVDALLNGTSIFPNNDTQRIVLPAGQSTEAQGYLFKSNNLAVLKGDILTLYVRQVGSTTPGTNGVVRVVTVR